MIFFIASGQINDHCSRVWVIISYFWIKKIKCSIQLHRYSTFFYEATDYGIRPVTSTDSGIINLSNVTINKGVNLPNKGIPRLCIKNKLMNINSHINTDR